MLEFLLPLMPLIVKPIAQNRNTVTFENFKISNISNKLNVSPPLIKPGIIKPNFIYYNN